MFDFPEFKVFRTPLRSVIDIDVGESKEVKLCNSKIVKIKVLELEEIRDSFKSSIRKTKVKVNVNGYENWIMSGNYNLPKKIANVQIDCPITKGYYDGAGKDVWALEKDLRLRLWPEDSPFIDPETFVYPVKQRWFASDTQMSNEPVFVNDGDLPCKDTTYYHAGLDIGGADGLVDVYSSVDGIVLSARDEIIAGYERLPFVLPRYDCIIILDERGWGYRYSHFKVIEDTIKAGGTVKKGQKLGILGKEGASGGWAHTHFEIFSRQPSGKWGTEEGYCYLWQAYVREYDPPLIAVARPHHMACVGKTVELDATRSWCKDKEGFNCEWQLTDGSLSHGIQVKRTYEKAGVYSEILKITDKNGNIDYDFTVVHVFDKHKTHEMIPSIHAAYAPTFDIKPNDSVTFLVRTFRTTAGNEIWDFGDGSSPVTVKSDGNIEPHNPDGYARIVHRYKKPGHYVARVERIGHTGAKAMAHLQIRVGEYS